MYVLLYNVLCAQHFKYVLLFFIMKRIHTYFSILFLIISHFSLAQVKSVPEFNFTKMADGSPFTPKDIPTGKKTLFVFFDTECPHCMRAISEYNEHEKELNDINVILITMDKRDVAVGFLKNFGPKLISKKNVTVLADKQNQFIAKFLPRKYPSMFLFGKSNQLIKYSDEETEIPIFLKHIQAK